MSAFRRATVIATVLGGLALSGFKAHALTTLTVGEDADGLPASPSIPVELRSDTPVAALQLDVLYDPLLYTQTGVAEQTLATPFLVDAFLVQPGTLRVVVHSRDNRALPAGVFFRIPLKATTDVTSAFPVLLANFILSTGNGAAISTGVTPSVRLVNLVVDQRINGKGGVQFSVETQAGGPAVSRVEFYAGGLKIGETTGAPFAFQWTPPGSGRFDIVAVVFDANGLQSSSRTIPIIVTNVGTTPIKAIYSGLVQSNPFAFAQSGAVTLATTVKNKFTGKVTLGSASYPLSGLFNADGVAEVTVKRKNLSPLNVALQLNATNLVDNITGVITDGTFVAGLATGGTFASAITGNRLVWDKKARPAPPRGAYTLVFPEPTGGPKGDGYGLVKVEANGAIKLTGALADGSKLSQATWLSKDAKWPLFVPLYAKAGGLHGELRFQDIMNLSDVDGPVTWQQKIAGANVPAPLTLAALGSLYRRPAKLQRVLALADAPGNARFTAEDGGLTEPLSKDVTISAKNTTTAVTPAADKLTLKIAPTTGALSGSFMVPGGKTKATLGGVVMQKQNLGAGFFRSKLGSGAFGLEASPTPAPAPMAAASSSVPALPVVTITGPESGVRVESPAAITLTGTAVGGKGIAGVYFQTIVNGVAGEIRPAVGTTRWTANLALDPDVGGPGTVFVKARDGAGRESELAAFPFTHVVMKDLAVQVIGAGAVTEGFAGVTAREVGSRQVLTATPAAGHRFIGWTGGITSAAAKIEFTMKPGLVVQAHFE